MNYVVIMIPFTLFTNKFSTSLVTDFLEMQSNSETESEENEDTPPVFSLKKNAFPLFVPVKTEEYCVCKSVLTTSEFTLSCQSCKG